MTDPGTLETDGTTYRLRFIRHLPHPQSKVWAALTEPSHLAAWFPQRIEGEWHVGAKLGFHDPQDRGPAFSGEVLAYTPETLIEFTWGTDTLRLELTPDDADSCTLVLLDTLEQQGTGARNAAGWHACLDLLTAHLADRPADFAPGERWSQVHPQYVASLGPEAATIGPPPGWKPES